MQHEPTAEFSVQEFSPHQCIVGRKSVGAFEDDPVLAQEISDTEVPPRAALICLHLALGIRFQAIAVPAY
ncbi:hypothetical protein ASD52_32205 [Ensifer sp. Root142]|nr:hypothetical protein ASD00_34590 [Ensifer sp. Root31]KQY69496.1 hypothetical protein ASD52_32205 [Ensifer sp. Root142]